ncbi:ATP-binding protein [Salimicrobium halophilum]|uniref:histidine kinase n=1 Tax=Salimicrobium halophilum TaxID=86666 RepID=A0A1G8WH21_9BACI|nr:ATP-binding protein [Salimicrobium halophilum]SDJ77582.1 two-component system, sensor histidine kinase YcbA [Salimicrobium halophilum]
MSRRKWFLLVMVIVMVPLAGELKFYPFEGDFRVSFGTPLFFFLLLWRRSLHRLTLIFSVAGSVVLFRTWLEVYGSPMGVEEAFLAHFPVFFYYMTYGLFYHRPLMIGLFGVLLEILASTVEILLRSGVMDQPLDFGTMWLLVEVAVIRSFFVLGFFNILLYKQVKIEEEQQKQQKEHIMMVVAGLYAEVTHLSKSMQDAETVIKESYDLYRKVNRDPEAEPSSALLGIANKVHEIKKDNQRIYAGLSNVVSRESDSSYLCMNSIADILMRSNATYAEFLGKEVHFRFESEEQDASYPTYVLLSLLNNLITNAVEAIESKGEIELKVTKENNILAFRVTDDGPGVPGKAKEVIFEQGYTSKFDSSGAPSTGIGLSYVREIVEKMEGTIKVITEESKNSFLIQVPEKKLMEMGE